MTDQSLDQIDIRVRPSWFSLLGGVGLLGFGALAVIGGSSPKELWPFWVISTLMLWSTRPRELHLTPKHFQERNMFWRLNKHEFKDLKWVETTSDEKFVLAFKAGDVIISNKTPKYKKLRAAIKMIAEECLLFSQYVPARRSALERGQLSGCLDCKSIFKDNEIKNWHKLEKSFWRSRKRDSFFAKCPKCYSNWVYTDSRKKHSVTKAGLIEMDKVFPKDIGRMTRSVKVR